MLLTGIVIFGASALGQDGTAWDDIVEFTVCHSPETCDGATRIKWDVTTGGTTVPPNAFKQEGDPCIITAIDLSGVTTIDQSAFISCTQLVRVNFEPGLISIGNSAFRDCNNLEFVTTSRTSTPADSTVTYGAVFPESLQEVGIRAFRNAASLTSVYLPGRSDDGNGLLFIASETFAYCTTLDRVFISDGVTTIGTEAFFSNNALKSLHLPAGITVAGDAFGFNIPNKIGGCIPSSPGLYASTTDDRRVFCNCNTGDTACVGIDEDEDAGGNGGGVTLPESFELPTEACAGAGDFFRSVTVAGAFAKCCLPPDDTGVDTCYGHDEVLSPLSWCAVATADKPCCYQSGPQVFCVSTTPGDAAGCYGSDTIAVRRRYCANYLVLDTILVAISGRLDDVGANLDADDTVELADLNVDVSTNVANEDNWVVRLLKRIATRHADNGAAGGRHKVVVRFSPDADRRGRREERVRRDANLFALDCQAATTEDLAAAAADALMIPILAAAADHTLGLFLCPCETNGVPFVLPEETANVEYAVHGTCLATAATAGGGGGGGGGGGSSDTSSETTGGGLDGGAIAGIVVGSLAGVGLIWFGISRSGVFTKGGSSSVNEAGPFYAEESKVFI